jgi:hypothetical protein
MAYFFLPESLPWFGNWDVGFWIPWMLLGKQYSYNFLHLLFITALLNNLTGPQLDYSVMEASILQSVVFLLKQLLAPLS